jgi:hypothetical protein
MLKQLALTAEPARFDLEELTAVAAAIQKQVARDFSPIWGVQATVDAFTDLDHVPVGYWRVVVVPEVEQGAGVHLDSNGQPFALVEAGPSWSLTASHEVLEMLADPFGNRLVAGPSPMPAQGRVEFLVEVCDPSEDSEFAYTSNGILVSDFYTPSYFDPTPAQGVRYSFTGAIEHPRQVLPGGYLSWRDPKSNNWFQLVHFGAEPEFRELGPLTAAGGLRAAVDERTPEVKRLSRVSRKTAAMLTSSAARSTNVSSAAARAAELRADIARITASAKAPRSSAPKDRRRVSEDAKPKRRRSPSHRFPKGRG